MPSQSAARCSVLALFVVFISTFAATALAAVPVHVVHTDLKSAIRAGVQSPVQFAVLVPYTLSTASGGSWSVANGRATWSYALQVPTAVSLSFHADQVQLPESATLRVRGAKSSGIYRAQDVHNSQLWSRIYPGQGLELTLTVAAAERSMVKLHITSLQAGYRAIGPGVEDHPYYRQLRARTAATSGNDSCVTSYECKVTALNAAPAAATVGVVVANLYQCTGSLINDVAEDNTPYLLTARHCETGQPGGGDSRAAAYVTVYWDATSACTSGLGSLYDPGIPTQTGATTVVEQQDAWLIKLDVNPVVPDAQFAGFDASGGAVQDGYTIHHAEGGDKQFTAWFGQAAAVLDDDVLNTQYLSNFWETVNQVGNVGPGASGSGLFDQNNHLVGSLTLGRQTNDPSGYGSCPLASPPAPNGSNGVADFTALAAVWNSTADSTSSTGSTTLKSTLDPGNTGTTTVPSMPVAYVSFTASAQTMSIGDSATLTWTAPHATQCTAGGGVAGDGWSGALAASGSRSLTESAVEVVTYTLSCTYAGGRTADTLLTLTWLGPSPALLFMLTSPTGGNGVWINAPAVLSWNSNVTPCAISGDGVALTNVPASGTTTVTHATPGIVNYTLTCGSPLQPGTYPLSVVYVTPSLVFDANGTDRLMGVPFFLTWSTGANSCTPSGGAPNDGWAGTQFSGGVNTFSPTVTMTGIYTYTLTCSGGPNSVQKSVTVTFENNAPYVTLLINPTTVNFTASPADYATVTWKTNLSYCGLATSPGLPLSIDSNPYLSDGDEIANPLQSGIYQVTVSCYGQPSGTATALATAMATLTVLPPPAPKVSISFSPNTVVKGESFVASWSGSGSASDCELTGGIPGEAWGAAVGFIYDITGSVPLTGQAGSYTFGAACQSIDPGTANTSTQVILNVGTVSANLTSSTTSVASGGSFTLTWTSAGAVNCTASGGGANGRSWSGSLGTSGSATQTADTVGTWTYTISCSQGDAVSTSSINVEVTAANGSGAGGGGGGGSIGWLDLSLLAAWQTMRRRRTRIPAARKSVA